MLSGVIFFVLVRADEANATILIRSEAVKISRNHTKLVGDINGQEVALNYTETGRLDIHLKA